MREPKTCLLVSNDPDDHQILFEALREISAGIVLTIIMDATHLETLLNAKIVRAHVVIVDPEMDDKNLSSQIERLKREKHLKLVLYTDTDEKSLLGVAVLSKRLPFSKTRAELEKILLGLT